MSLMDQQKNKIFITLKSHLRNNLEHYKHKCNIKFNKTIPFSSTGLNGYGVFSTVLLIGMILCINIHLVE